MNVLVWLGIILFLLMMLVGGKKGARSFFTLFLNFGVLFITIIFMTQPQYNPIVLTLIACTIISAITLFFTNSINSKTVTAFLSTMITTILLLGLIFVVTEYAMIQGFGEEEIEELSMFSIYVGVDFVKIGASVIIMSTIGAIADTAISITSPMHEISNHAPTMSKSALFSSGISIGKDILGTSANTLFFAFFGGYLALLIWFKDLSYSFGQIVNSKVFSAEIMTILCAGTGVALIIPITSWVTASHLVKTRRKGRER
ncbi:YibE/F family protein [Shouchella shacheensis]|uniref:YibE/F family protein n=1 Tax=Shouchella shacheensis TaxID=1649580 RepID=UPI0007400467|nr:YibE/F family protein [Shouchella shacheensis]